VADPNVEGNLIGKINVEEKLIKKIFTEWLLLK
jgi:hypothetical protein